MGGCEFTLLLLSVTPNLHLPVSSSTYTSYKAIVASQSELWERVRIGIQRMLRISIAPGYVMASGH